MSGALRRAGMLLCLLILAGASSALAQVSTGEVFGKITDGTGAVLPGVTVTVSGPALIQAQTTISVESGAYRFPRIPVGTYTVTFDLVGFKKSVHDGIVIQAGFNAEIDTKMEISTVEETVTVSGESPVVDTRSTTLSASFSREALETIPTARDPWVVLQQTPGMVMSGQNVGGNLSGQQTSFTAMGSSTNQQWTMDGAVVSDIASNNSSPTYYDFDSFEEINVTKGGSDASQQGGGIQVNFVTKSGGNTLRGSGRYYKTNQKFEANNITDRQRDLNAAAGNPIQDIKDYGFELGGPIVKNKFWYWGTASTNNIDVGIVNFFDTSSSNCAAVAANAGGRTSGGGYQYAIKELWDCYKTDNTTLINYNGKLQFQENTANKSTFVVTDGIKRRNARGADAFHPLITTRRQDGPTVFYRGDHQWIASNRLTMTAQYTHISENWGQFLQNDSLFDVQPLNFVDAGGTTGLWDRNSGSGNYETHRPQDDLRADANYFLSSVLKGDHAMKFGFSYRRSPVESITTYGGGAIARMRTNPGTCVVGGTTYTLSCQEANVVRDADNTYILYSQSAYWNDSYKTGRTTINVGVRFDRQYDIAIAASTPANRLLPALLPAVSFPGADSGARYKNLSPRLGFTYDLRGNGKTVLKANVARYYGLGMSTASRIQPTASTTLRYAWKDLNNDTLVQANELDLSRFLTTPSSNYNPNNPSAAATPNTVDPALRNDVTDEFAAGVEHELWNSVGLSVFYYHRKYFDFQRLFRTQDFSGAFVAVPFTASCGNAATCGTQTFAATYYQRPGTVGLNASQILRNDGRYFTYDGLELSARKRLSHHYMMSGSIVFNREREYLPQPDRDYLDPTNIAFTNGYEGGSAVYSGTTWPVGSNLRQIPWVGKLGGMYSFPWAVTAAANFIGQAGSPLNPYLQSPNRTSSMGTVNILLQPNNSSRYDNYYQLDLHVDKGLKFRGGRRITLNADLFNAFNNNVVLETTERQNSSSANNITRLLAPRVARFGVKVSF